MPPPPTTTSETLPCVSPYIPATLFMTHFIHPSPATLISPVRRCKNNHPGSRLALISLPSGEATWDKAQAALDTSNQWNPQGLRWVFNEVHCSQLESPSPRNALTFRLLFVLVLLVGSLQSVHDQHKAAYPTLHLSLWPEWQQLLSLSFIKQRSIISL